MDINLKVTFSADDGVTERLERLEQMIRKQGEQMAVDYTNLTAALQKEADAETAVENLLTTLTAEIKTIAATADAATQAKLDALATDISSRADVLSAAVVANTPAA